MSLGIRSGVNWMRLKSSLRLLARVRTISVLASPGTPTIRPWPRQKMVTSICSSTFSCPMMTLRISFISVSRAAPSRSISRASRSCWLSLTVGSLPDTKAFTTKDTKNTKEG